MKKLFTILSAMLLSINLLSAKTLTGKVAVGAGKGEVSVETRSRYGVGVEGPNATTNATQAVASADNGVVYWAFCKFVATAATGYTFEGWYTNQACTQGRETDNPLTTADAKNVDRTDEYWAKFTPNTYKVTFNAEGGTVEPATKNVTFDAAYGDGEGGWPTPERTGYIFEGWYKNDGTTLVEASTTVSAASNLAVYAHWTPITYHVAFDGNGSTTGSMESQDFTYDAAQDLTVNGFAQAYTVQFDAKVSAIEPLVSNSEFIGWATSAQGEKEYDNEQNVSNLTAENDATIQLFALWNAGSIVLPSVEKEGYQFEGWFLNDEKIGDAGFEYVPTSDVTLAARWTSFGEFSATTCGEAVEFNEQTYEESFAGEVHLTNIYGGDSVVTVSITINQPTFGTDELTITIGDDVEWNGVALKDSIVGTHTVVAVLTNVAGCDSTVTLTLTVNKQETVEMEPVMLSFCPGDSVEYRGKWYFEYALDTIYAEGDVRDTIIYVEAMLLPTTDLMVLYDTIVSGNEVILPEGEWVIGEDTVSGTYPTVESEDASELIFHQYFDEPVVCGPNYIELIVTVTPKEQKPGETTAFERVNAQSEAVKEFRNGALYIRRGDRLFTAEGREVK